eukprot:11261395-Alexandrium_andersonii.AAC.1
MVSTLLQNSSPWDLRGARRANAGEAGPLSGPVSPLFSVARGTAAGDSGLPVQPSPQGSTSAT